MEASDKFMFVNIREYLAEGDNDKVGEPELLRIISDFSCPKNPDVEHFLKNSSIDFTRKNQSVTYIVLDMDDGALAGYCTIALKPLTVRDETVSNTVKRKIKRISEFDGHTKSYTMSAYLIARIGKNYTNDACSVLRVQSFSNWHGVSSRICSIWAVEWWYSLKQTMRKNY